MTGIRASCQSSVFVSAYPKSNATLHDVRTPSKNGLVSGTFFDGGSTLAIVKLSRPQF